MIFNLNLDNINYIKIVYSDRDGNARCVKATIKNLGEREIYACAKMEEGISIKTPQDIILSFISDNGLFRTNTVLKYIVFQEPFIYFAMKAPDGMEYQQNREYFRVKSSEKVLITYIKNDINNSISCLAHDISANGIRVLLDTKLEFPEEVSLKISFENKDISTNAKFIRFDDEDDKLKAAFSFTQLKEQDMDFISQQCIRRQIEEKRNKI